MKRVPLISIILIAVSCNPKENADNIPKIGDLLAPSGAYSALPYLIKGDNEQLYFSWVERIADTVIFKYSQWSDQTWSNPIEIARGTDWFVNWADYPMISSDVEGRMMSHFLAKSANGTYSYDVHVSQSSDGRVWSEDFIPHRDGTPTEHGFVTMLPYKDKFVVAWLDGRNTGLTDHSSATGHGAMTLRSAFISKDGNMEKEVELDDRVCDCCQTGGAITSNGPVIVYRDRSENEIRDMSIVRLAEGEWTPPKTIFADNWEIAGCPVNGPRVSSIDNILAIGWFTASEGQSHLSG